MVVLSGNPVCRICVGFGGVFALSGVAISLSMVVIAVAFRQHFGVGFVSFRQQGGLLPYRGNLGAGSFARKTSLHHPRKIKGVMK